MFEYIPANNEELTPSGEKKTPPAPPAKDEESKNQPDPEENVSEDEKTPPKDDGDSVKEEPFQKHSRFRELVAEKNNYKAKYESVNGALEELRTEIASLKEVKSGEIDQPTFETWDDMVKFVSQMPAKIRQEVMDDFKNKDTAEAKKKSEVDKIISDQIQTLKDSGEEFEDKALLKFAYDNEIVNLEKALGLMKTFSKEKKKAEEIGKRKADSSPKDSKGTSSPPKQIFQRGSSLDDVVQWAKDNLPK